MEDWWVQSSPHPSIILKDCNTRDHLVWSAWNGDPMQRVNYQISLYPPHENRKIERSVRKRHQQIGEEVRNLERRKDGKNKMRDMS